MEHSFALENGLDLKQVLTTGSVLEINEHYEDTSTYETEKLERKPEDHIGWQVTSFDEIENTLVAIDQCGYIKKKIIEEGGGFPITDNNTVSIAYSGFWENEDEPFDCRKQHKPLVVDLKESGLLPGLELAVKSMLVGEMSVFLFTHHVMYGEMGVPPRIKPKAKSCFYIKLVKSIITPKEGRIDFSESNIFNRVLHEARKLYSSGQLLFKTKNYTGTIQLFRKASFMLQRCRLADEEEEKVQERLLVKLYTNLAICYLKTKLPLKACVACNELRRLNVFWNNPKVLYLNAKALRMIGQFDVAEKRLRKALRLSPSNEEIKEEFKTLKNVQQSNIQSKLLIEPILKAHRENLTEDFKKEVRRMIKNFKENSDLYTLVMPAGLNSLEREYVKEIAVKENIFFNKVDKGDADMLNQDNNTDEVEPEVDKYALDKYKIKDWEADIEALCDSSYYDH